jgi:hypothetical protein
MHTQILTNKAVMTAACVPHEYGQLAAHTTKQRDNQFARQKQLCTTRSARVPIIVQPRSLIPSFTITKDKLVPFVSPAYAPKKTNSLPMPPHLPNLHWTFASFVNKTGLLTRRALLDKWLKKETANWTDDLHLLMN